MDLLLDTQVLLWWDRDDPQLGAAARHSIASAENRVFVSAASIWEAAIKVRLGKLRMKGKPSLLLEANGFLPLPIQPGHGELAGALEWSHRDPFDRMLVVQAMEEGLILVHADREIRGYPQVQQLWAGVSPTPLK